MNTTVEEEEAYRELSAERAVAEAAYRLLHRRPDLFSEAEARWWEARLAAVYDRLAPLEWDLDVLRSWGGFGHERRP